MRLYRSLFYMPKYLNAPGKQGHFLFQHVKHIKRTQQQQQQSTTASDVPLTKYQAFEIVHKLTEIERESLREALSQYELDKFKIKVNGKYNILHQQ